MAKQHYDNSDYEELIDMKQVPILPLDNRWHQLFPNNNKPPRIKKLEKQVMDLVKRESGVSTQMRDLSKLKKNLMKEIVNNMQESDEKNEKLRQKKLAASQKLIGDINDKVYNLENEKYQLPYKLMEANRELLIESIELCYQRLQTNQEHIEALSEWIEKTRIELKEKVVIKQEKEEMNNNIYAYMHDILGPEFMEVFDKNHTFSDKKNRG